MSKVRFIDWSPADWIAGTFGVLTTSETAVYMAVLMQIYARADACPNDIDFIAGHFKREGQGKHTQARSAHTARLQRALDRLIELGKLRVSTDGRWLTNGRAEIELNKARERIGGAFRAGLASGRARRGNPKPAPSQPPTQPQPRHPPSNPKSSKSNDLASTDVRIMNTTTIKSHDREISTGAAREPSPELEAAQARAHTGQAPKESEAPHQPTDAPLVTAEQKTSPVPSDGFSVPSNGKLPQSPFEGEVKPPTPGPKAADRLAALAAAAREKLLKGGSS